MKTRHVVKWMLLFLLIGGPTFADTPAGQGYAEMDRRLDGLETELSRTNLRIDGINNGVLQQVLIPIVIGLVTLVLARWDSKRQMRVISDQEIAKWMERVGNERWNKVLQDYLKANFPGRIDYLLAAARSIAHEQELQQTKRIRVIGMRRELSERIVQLLKARGFLQVEFVPYQKGMKLPDAEIVLVDRYSCIKATPRMNEDDVKALFDAAKNLSQGPFIHYFGETVIGLPVLMNERAALSSAEFSLLPNLLDQLKFAFPQPQ